MLLDASRCIVDGFIYIYIVIIYISYIIYNPTPLPLGRLHRALHQLPIGLTQGEGRLGMPLGNRSGDLRNHTLWLYPDPVLDVWPLVGLGSPGTLLHKVEVKFTVLLVDSLYLADVHFLAVPDSQVVSLRYWKGFGVWGLHRAASGDAASGCVGRCCIGLRRAMLHRAASGDAASGCGGRCCIGLRRAMLHRSAAGDAASVCGRGGHSRGRQDRQGQLRLADSELLSIHRTDGERSRQTSNRASSRSRGVYSVSPREMTECTFIVPTTGNLPILAISAVACSTSSGVTRRYVTAEFCCLLPHLNKSCPKSLEPLVLSPCSLSIIIDVLLSWYNL